MTLDRLDARRAELAMQQEYQRQTTRARVRARAAELAAEQKAARVAAEQAEAARRAAAPTFTREAIVAFAARVSEKAEAERRADAEALRQSRRQRSAPGVVMRF